MEQDTRFGQLLDVAFRHQYGEDFKWERAVITNEGNGNYITEIDEPPQYLGDKDLRERIESKFRREVIPSGSQKYSQEVKDFLGSMNSAYFMISKQDWQALKV